MAELRGNLLVGQSGGPTAVVNASLVGVLDEAHRHSRITRLYGMRHGVAGLLDEDLVDLGRLSSRQRAHLKRTPSAALGTCRVRLRPADDERLLEILRAHGIRYFLYIGGDGSAQTVHRLAVLAADQGYELRAVAIPKTIDNDLDRTDHCPGYPSVARWLAVSVREAGLDTEAIGVVDTVKVIETMGRDTGWIAAATSLAREQPGDAPHLIYLPERPFNRDRLLADVERVYREHASVVIAIAEGIKDERGEYLAASSRAIDADPLGRPQLGGAAHVVCELVAAELGLKARFDKPGTIQRVSATLASPVDLAEAYRVGQAAVRSTVEGHSDVMVAIVRRPGPTYSSTTRLVPLHQVVGRVKAVPDHFINAEGNGITRAFLRYLAPLVGGVPSYARLDDIRPVAPKLRDGKNAGPLRPVRVPSERVREHRTRRRRRR